MSFVINDGTDYGVKYSALETAFNNLRDDYNNFKALHKHGGVLVGTGSTAVSDMVTPNAADITLTKVLKVRI